MRLSTLVALILFCLFMYLYTSQEKPEEQKRGSSSFTRRPFGSLGARRERFDPTNVQKSLGLITRADVPQKVKMALNVMNAPAIKGMLNIPDMPDYFDCREKWPGLITGPLDQADCGSCWAFAIATASSDRLRIADPNHRELTRKIKYREGDKIIEELENFNPWHLASCDLCSTSPIGKLLKENNVCGNDACSGQILQVGMQYMRTHGLILTSCDPHQEACLKDESQCIYDCETNQCEVYRPLFFHQLDDSLADELGTERGKFAQYTIMSDGPIMIGITVYQSMMDFFQDPKNAKKVYSHKVKNAAKTDKKIGGHAVVTIGWGTDEDNMDYWIIRNSWGRDWADEGYFRIERGVNFIGCGDDVWSAHWGNKCTTCIDVLLGPSTPEGKTVVK